MILNLNSAMELRKGTPVIYTKFDSLESEEMKWVELQFHSSGQVRCIVEDEDGNHWWGYLAQIHTFDEY